MRDEITRQGFGLYVATENRIPELDALARDGSTSMLADYSGEQFCVMYSLYCPESWFDLWGWADDNGTPETIEDDRIISARYSGWSIEDMR